MRSPALLRRRAAVATGIALVLVSGSASSFAAKGAPASAYVRVNQVGYAAAASSAPI
jgi:hypothetical protein